HDALSDGLAVDRHIDGAANTQILQGVLAIRALHKRAFCPASVRLEKDQAGGRRDHVIVFATAILQPWQVARGRVLDDIKVTGEQAGKAWPGIGHGYELYRVPMRSVAPVVVVALQLDARALHIGLEFVWAGTNGIATVIELHDSGPLTGYAAAFLRIESQLAVFDDAIPDDGQLTRQFCGQQRHGR